MWQSVCLCFCVFARLHVCMFVCLFACLLACLFVCLFVWFFVCSFVRPYVCLFCLCVSLVGFWVVGGWWVSYLCWVARFCPYSEAQSLSSRTDVFLRGGQLLLYAYRAHVNAMRGPRVTQTSQAPIGKVWQLAILYLLDNSLLDSSGLSGHKLIGAAKNSPFAAMTLVLETCPHQNDIHLLFVLYTKYLLRKESAYVWPAEKSPWSALELEVMLLRSIAALASG